MIPHERDMVERFKDKPFALVSISADARKETLKDFLSKEKMPWTHWWNGTRGGRDRRLERPGFPTIFVIDAQGDHPVSRASTTRSLKKPSTN